MTAAVSVALGATRVITDVGYVMFAGTFTFWAVAWPRGPHATRLVRMAAIGVGVLIIATVARPAVQLADGRLLGDVITSTAGAMVIVQLAALVAAAFFLPDIVRGDVIGWRRVAAIGLAVVVAITLSVQSPAVGGRWAPVEVVVTVAHVLATAAWLGGLIALAVVLAPRESLDGLAPVMRSVTRLQTVSIVVLVATGVVQVLTTAGPAALLTGYGIMLLIKVVLFAAVLVVAAYGRTYVARVTFRAAYVGGAEPTGAAHPGVRALELVLRAQLVLALAVVVVTSALVAVTPRLG